MSAKSKFLAATLLMLFVLSHSASAATIGFKPAVNYAAGTVPKAAAVADFNQDGNVDLAVANNGNAGADDDGNVSILQGNGDGTFQAAVNHAAGKNPAFVATGDFNGDGRKDLVVASNSSPTVSVLLGNGDGTFPTPVDYAAGPYSLRGLVVGDFNGDNQLDFAVVGSVVVLPYVPPGEFHTTVSVLLGNGDGSFQAPVDYALGVLTGAPVGPLPQGLAAADLSGDGDLDLAAATRQGVAILLGTGNGSFTGPTFVSAGLSIAVAAGDFTGDNHPDLVVSNYGFSLPSYSLLLNNGNGTFQAGSSVKTANVMGEFDGDGKLDVAGFTADCGSILDPCTNQRLDVLPGNGDGTFQPEVSFPGAFHPLLAADLDGNGSPDLVASLDSSPSSVSVLANTAGTDFSISASTASPTTVSRGQSSTSTVTLHLLNAFDTPVALACSVQPAQAASTCSLNPNSVTFDASGNAAAMLTINTGTTSASLVPPSALRDSQPPQVLWLPVAGVALVAAGLGRGGARRKRLLNFLASGIILTGLVLQTGCGGGSSDRPPSPQTYTVTVTGKSGSIQHSTTVTLRVQ